MSKAKKDKPKPKADIGFERELWSAANELRGAVAENQYVSLSLAIMITQMKVGRDHPPLAIFMRYNKLARYHPSSNN